MLITYTLFPSGSVSAHGGGGVRRLSYEPIGSHYLHVWTSPAVARVGRLHIEALVTDANYQPVAAQRVIIELTSAQSNIAPMRAIAQLDKSTSSAMFASWRSPPRQGADFLLQHPGDYQVEITILDTNSQGGRANFGLQVSQANSWSIVVLQGALPLLGLVGGWLFVEGLSRLMRYTKHTVA